MLWAPYIYNLWLVFISIVLFGVRKKPKYYEIQASWTCWTLVLKLSLKSCSSISPTEHGIHNRIGFYHSVCYSYDLDIGWKLVADIHCLEYTWNERSDKFLVRKYGGSRSTGCSNSDAPLHGSFLLHWNDWCGRWPIL